MLNGTANLDPFHVALVDAILTDARSWGNGPTVGSCMPLMELRVFPPRQARRTVPLRLPPVQRKPGLSVDNMPQIGQYQCGPPPGLFFKAALDRALVPPPSNRLRHRGHKGYGAAVDGVLEVRHTKWRRSTTRHIV